MKYVWMVVVIIGIAGIFLGVQRQQLDETGSFGEYPCFLCTSETPDYEIYVFSAVPCAVCERGITRVQVFCQLTGIAFGGAYYEDAEETFVKLEELGLQMNSEFLVVIVRDGVIIDTTTDAERVEQVLSELVKEESRL